MKISRIGGRETTNLCRIHLNEELEESFGGSCARELFGDWTKDRNTEKLSQNFEYSENVDDVGFGEFLSSLFHFQQLKLFKI